MAHSDRFIQMTSILAIRTRELTIAIFLLSEFCSFEPWYILWLRLQTLTFWDFSSEMDRHFIIFLRFFLFRSSDIGRVVPPPPSNISL